MSRRPFDAGRECRLACDRRWPWCICRIVFKEGAVGLMSRQEYLDSLRKRSIQVIFRGEQLQNVVDHPLLWPPANTLAETYRLAQDPGHAAMLTAKSHLTGNTINVSNQIWRSTDDLVKRIRWERLVGQLTARGALRSPGLDAINTLAIVCPKIDAKLGTSYARRLEAFVRQAQDHDWALSGAMTDPRGDRSRRPSQQPDPDLFLRIVERRKDGIVLRGAKAHQTSAVHSHWHLVLPMSCQVGEEDWAVSCAVPSDAKNLFHLLSRQPGDGRRLEKWPLDQGCPDFGGCESLMVFDDVFVPNEFVFLAGETAYTAEIVKLFGSFHRFCYGGCKVGVGDVLIGAAVLIADANGVLEKSSIREKLTEMVHLNETMYSCAIAAATLGQEAPGSLGVFMPDVGLANVTKLNVTRFPFEMARLAADIAGGNMTTLPSEGDLRHPEYGKYVRKYMQARKGFDPEDRMRVLRLIEFLTHGMGSTYFLHESLHGAGAPEAMKITLRRETDFGFFASLARSLCGASETAGRPKLD